MCAIFWILRIAYWPKSLKPIHQRDGIHRSDAPVPERRPGVVVVNHVTAAAAKIAAAATAAAAKETAHVGHRIVVLATRARNHNDNDDGSDHDETGTGEFNIREDRGESITMWETW